MNVIKDVIASLIIIPVMLVILILTAITKITMRFGIGQGLYDYLGRITTTIAPLRVREIQPYNHPVSDRFSKGGHMRFTGIRTANAKGVPLQPEQQKAMLYIGRVNYFGRLMEVSPEMIRQLNLEFAKRRFHVKEVFVYPPDEVQKFGGRIKLQEERNDG